MFHYNLACSYAELDDLDSALGDLKFAFAYRQNGTSWGRRCKRSFLPAISCWRAVSEPGASSLSGKSENGHRVCLYL